MAGDLKKMSLKKYPFWTKGFPLSETFIFRESWELWGSQVGDEQGCVEKSAKKS